MSSHYPRLVELQPYALEAIRHYCPCLGQRLQAAAPVVVRLVSEAELFFRIAILENDRALRELAVACPPKMRDLFYQTPHTQLGPKVLDLLKSGYERWLKAQDLTHPLQLSLIHI